MCIGISGIIHRGRYPLLWVGSNSHTKILKHFNLTDDQPVELRKFVKFELHPSGCLTSIDPADWVFVLDEDDRPDWFIESDWDSRCIAAAMRDIIPEWIKDGCPCSLNLVDTNVTSLGNLQSVGGYLNCMYCSKFSSLGSLKSVGGYLDCFYCKNLASLGNLKLVGGYLDLRHCNKLPSISHIEVEGDIYS